MRTIVEVETDDGIIGLGEMGGGGESAELAFEGLSRYLVGHDPFQLEALRFKIANPTASLYNNRTQLQAALEFACLDLMGQALGVPVHDLLGGKLRDEVPFASYLFFRYRERDRRRRGPHRRAARRPRPRAQGRARLHRPQAQGRRLPARPRARRATARSPTPSPTTACATTRTPRLTLEEAIRFGQAIEDLRNDYFEDPTWGLNGMRRVRAAVRIPTATNTVVVNFEQLAANILDPAVDVILLDTTFWGGIRPCIKAAGVCETFQLGIAVHSSGELGIQLATMLHLGAVLPNLTFAGRRPLPSPCRRRDRGRQAPLPRRRHRGPGRARPRRPPRPRQGRALGRALRELGGYPYDRDPLGRAGSPWSRTPAGPTRSTIGCRP